MSSRGNSSNNSKGSRLNSFDYLNLFPGLNSTHFDSSGFLVQKGIKLLLSKLKNKKSKIYSFFGDICRELFLEYYNTKKYSLVNLTIVARDLILLNRLLFDEELHGPDSSLVRIVFHLFSFIQSKNIKNKLKKLLVEMIIFGGNEPLLQRKYSNFMSLFLSNTSKYSLKHITLYNEIKNIFELTRAIHRGLRQLDLLYSRSKKTLEKRRVLKDSQEYLNRLFNGSFSSILSVVDFFVRRNYILVLSSIQEGLALDGVYLEHSFNLYSHRSEVIQIKSIVIKDRMKNLMNKFESYSIFLFNSLSSKKIKEENAFELRNRIKKVNKIIENIKWILTINSPTMMESYLSILTERFSYLFRNSLKMYSKSKKNVACASILINYLESFLHLNFKSDFKLSSLSRKIIELFMKSINESNSKLKERYNLD